MLEKRITILKIGRRYDVVLSIEGERPRRTCLGTSLEEACDLALEIQAKHPEAPVFQDTTLLHAAPAYTAHLPEANYG